MRVGKEAAAVLRWGDTEAANKGAAKAVGIVKANRVGDTPYGTTDGR